MTGERLSHYLVLERLGEGSRTIVFKAEDLALGRLVALKLVAPAITEGPAMITRFHHEARTASCLNHPNIRTIYEIGEHEGRHFIVMELLEGDVLSKVIAGRTMDLGRAIDLAAQLADALASAHAEGVVHRDIKPANLFITTRGQLKVLDFGLAVQLPLGSRPGTWGAQPTTTVGTLPYMAPEQLSRGPVDPRSDIFSAGVVLYEMLTGQRAFTGSGEGPSKNAILNREHPSLRGLNPSILDEVERIVGKALEKNPALRFQTALDLRGDLERVRRDLHTPVVAVRSAPHVQRQDSITPRRLTLAGSVIVAGGLMAALSVGVESDRLVPRAAGTIARVESAGVLPSRSVTPLATSTIAPTVFPLRPATYVHPARTSTGTSWIAQELALAQAKRDARLFDQALETLHNVVSRPGVGAAAVDAHFLIASIHEQRGKVDDALAAYLEIVHRYPTHPRAAEALYSMGQATLGSNRPERDAEAQRLLTNLVTQYRRSLWAPRALMMRAESEERQKLYRRDEELAGSVPAALISYRQVATEYGRSSQAESAWWKLGQIYTETKRYPLAAHAYVTLATRFPGTRLDAWFAAAELYEKRLDDRARAQAAYALVPVSSPRYRDAQKRARR